MTPTTIQLAKAILFCNGKSITKVRFAKLIYFVFKDLVSESLLSYKDIRFIRMPLGPVPDGFMSFENLPDFKVDYQDSGLGYDRQVFSLASSNRDFPLAEQVKSSLLKYKHVSTSSLIEYSHRDPSWKKNSNGRKYFITDADISDFPAHKKTKKISDEIDRQLIQSFLVNGQINEIVQDSTSLEYPDYYEDIDEL